MSNKHKLKVRHLIIGIVCAKIWRYILRDVPISCFYKFVVGLVVILIVYFTYVRIKNR